jgi:hypothetical protein
MLFKISVWILSLLLIFILSLSRCVQCTCYHEQIGPGEEICDSFKSWLDLKQSINRTTFYTFNQYSSLFLNVHPLKPIRLTSEFDIVKLVGSYNGGKWVSDNQSLQLDMIGMSGIDVAKWPANLATESLTIHIENSYIAFYLNGTLFSQSSLCSQGLIESQTDEQSFFIVFPRVSFESTNHYPSDESFCPYVFSNAQMEWVAIYGLADAVLIKNIWSFMSEKKLNETTINSNIQGLVLRGYGYNLDTSLMHPLVFEQTEWIRIYNSIKSIQTDLFQYFRRVSILFFQLNSLRNFFHNIGIAWTTSLPLANLPLLFFSPTDSSWIDGPVYTFPDTDFCLFGQYPQQNSLTFVFNSLNKCTSTLLWLLFNYFTKDMSNLFYNYPHSKIIYSICANSSNGTFDFEPLLARCNITHDTGETTIYAEFYQVKYIIEFIEDLLIFLGIPCACLLGLFLNTLIIYAVHKNKEKELKDSFYAYMSLNAVFNCMYCVIFLFYPVSSCINSWTGFFCSSIRQLNVVQFFKIVFVAYFGETFKMCANISYILMNVNRYMLIGREHKPLFENISKWDLKWVVGLTFISSALINVGHGFQYSLNDSKSYSWFTSNFYIFVEPSYPDDLSIDDSLSLYIYTLVYFLINFLLFFVVNTWVEVTIVRKLHSELADKKKRLGGMGMEMTTAAVIRSSATISATLMTSFRKNRRREIDAGAERRAILMVVINALINFFFRLPELIVLLAQSDSLMTNNFIYEFFNTFTDLQTFPTYLMYLFYICTFSSNFLIYYLFNQKFKQTFSEWRHVKKNT